MDGQHWGLEEVFKHDSWAATALYRAGGRGIVVKFNRCRRIGVIPMSWLGRWLAAREASACERLAGVPGIPRAFGAVEADGFVFRNALAREHVEGHPLGKDEKPGEIFFERLRELLAAMHSRGIAYLDLNKRENVIVTSDARPALVDFQIHFSAPAALSYFPPVRWLVRVLQRADLYHCEKLRAYHMLGADAAARLETPLSARIWRLVYVGPVQFVRRRLLVALRIRSGEGLAVSELEPEQAVRLGRRRVRTE